MEIQKFWLVVSDLLDHVFNALSHILFVFTFKFSHLSFHHTISVDIVVFLFNMFIQECPTFSS